MGKILKYIEGNGKKFQRFKTKKMSLDASDNDTIAYNYDDNYDFRETSFSDIVKCEMALLQEDKPIKTGIINVISANLIREAYPVCFGSNTRWANHLYPVCSTESFCKFYYYIDSNVNYLEKSYTFAFYFVMAHFVQNIIDEIIDQYMFADNTKRPWIIGFSGGKDSTVMLQLVWQALEQVKHFHGFVGRNIYVVCNDTMVENPVITEYVYRVLDKIEVAARDQDLPIRVIKTLPRLEDSLWVNMIGRGYPAPNNAFRWCTERLKIKPTSRFITEQVNEFGEAIILIGTRMSESANRAKSMNKHAIKGKRLTKHPLQPNTYIYAPIRHLQLEQIWYIINTMQSPWDASNEELFQIYANASADDYECPVVVTDIKHKSCGQSRFGCWMCTVVKEDKSMGALIYNGFAWLKPLLDFRDEIVAERNDIKNRMPIRRNGTQAVNDMGPYYPFYRASILKRLLKTQKEIQKERPRIELITNQELIAIQTIWYRDFIFDYKVSEIYHNAYKSNLDMDKHNKKKDKELELLKNSCKSKPQNFDLIQELLTLQKNKSLLNRKRGLKDDIETRIEEYLKKEQENAD